MHTLNAPKKLLRGRRAEIYLLIHKRTNVKVFQ